MKAFIFIITGLFFASVGAVGAAGALERCDSAPADVASSSEPATPARTVSKAELAKHAAPTDCWIAVRGKVYDVTRYIDDHPAPRETITSTCGTDATVAFETKNRGRAHSAGAQKLLEGMSVGTYAP
jgi:cytochrome b involved in lipid metabolism